MTEKYSRRKILGATATVLADVGLSGCFQTREQSAFEEMDEWHMTEDYRFFREDRLECLTGDVSEFGKRGVDEILANDHVIFASRGLETRGTGVYYEVGIWAPEDYTRSRLLEPSVTPEDKSSGNEIPGIGVFDNNEMGELYSIIDEDRTITSGGNHNPDRIKKGHMFESVPCKDE